MVKLRLYWGYSFILNKVEKLRYLQPAHIKWSFHQKAITVCSPEEAQRIPGWRCPEKCSRNTLRFFQATTQSCYGKVK